MKCLNCNLHFAEYREKEKVYEYYSQRFWTGGHNIKLDNFVPEFNYRPFFLRNKILSHLVELTGARMLHALSEYDYMKQYISGKKLLEVGSGEGFVLQFFEKKGFSVYGIEPSKDAVEIINKRLKKGKAVTGVIDDLRKLEEKFDVIILVHVFEHLVSCRDALSILKNVLSDNGIMLIEVPNGEIPGILESSTTGSVTAFPELYQFSKRSLEELMSHTNFKILRMDVLYSKPMVSMWDYFIYFLHWVFRRDYFTQPPNKELGHHIRILVTHSDK